ncbi:hypothetical protein [Ensifer soli]
MALTVLSITMFFSLLFATVKALRAEQLEDANKDVFKTGREVYAWPRQ